MTIPDNIPASLPGWALAAVFIVREIFAGFRTVARVHKRIDQTVKRVRKLEAKAGITDEDE